MHHEVPLHNNTGSTNFFSRLRKHISLNVYRSSQMTQTRDVWEVRGSKCWWRIIDGAAVGQMTNPQTSKKFGEYYGIEIKEQAERIAHTDERVHIVFDIYRKASRKR